MRAHFLLAARKRSHFHLSFDAECSSTYRPQAFFIPEHRLPSGHSVNHFYGDILRTTMSWVRNISRHKIVLISTINREPWVSSKPRLMILYKTSSIQHHYYYSLVLNYQHNVFQFCKRYAFHPVPGTYRPGIVFFHIPLSPSSPTLHCCTLSVY